MNLNELHHKLIAAARTHPPADRVPYAFEQRILARLTQRAAVDPWAWWVRGLGRAAVSCVAISLLLGAWTLLNPTGAGPAEEFSQQFENTVFAAVDHADENSW